jgi:hypothetical protein
MSINQERLGRGDADGKGEQATPAKNRLMSRGESFFNIVLFIDKMRSGVNLFFGK